MTGLAFTLALEALAVFPFVLTLKVALDRCVWGIR
jgi:hypothetical protein